MVRWRLTEAYEGGVLKVRLGEESASEDVRLQEVPHVEQAFPGIGRRSGAPAPNGSCRRKRPMRQCFGAKAGDRGPQREMDRTDARAVGISARHLRNEPA